MENGFDILKFLFSTETWAGIFTIAAAVWGGYKAHQAKEAEKRAKLNLKIKEPAETSSLKGEEITWLREIIDELQQERDNDKRDNNELRERLRVLEKERNEYFGSMPTKRISSSNPTVMGETDD